MAGDLRDLQQNWEALAQEDPLWAVLTDPALRGRGWGSEEFLASGEREIQTVISRLATLTKPRFELPALDFGCGAGRLTQALARRFAAAHGVDISEAMLRTARELNREGDRAVFHLNQDPTLATFEDGTFGLIYSSLVLQHMQPAHALGYVREFLRIAAPGGLVVFQIPDRFVPRCGRGLIAEQLRGAAGRLRRDLALGTRLRQRRLRIHRDAPAGKMEMHAVPEAQVRACVAEGGGRVIDVVLTNSSDVDFNGNLRYLPEEPANGWVSKQYAVAL